MESNCRRVRGEPSQGDQNIQLGALEPTFSMITHSVPGNYDQDHPLLSSICHANSPITVDRTSGGALLVSGVCTTTLLGSYLVPTPGLATYRSLILVAARHFPFAMGETIGGFCQHYASDGTPLILARSSVGRRSTAASQLH